MKRLFQLILIILLTTTSTASYAFIGKFKALFKLGAGTEGIKVIDNVATEALSLRKIDKKLINKLSSQKEVEIIQAVKETPDEAILSNYKNIDDVSLKNDTDDWWRYLHPGYRHLAKDVKPENFIYACETNTGEAYYFSLLPKRNLALVSSSADMIGSQRLKIRSSSPEGTVLINLDSNGTKDYFFLLPNYQFYVGNHPTSSEFEVLPNGQCYNTEINFNKNEIKFTQYQITQEKKEPKFIEKNLDNFIYLILIWIGWSIFGYLFDKNIKKDEKKTIKFFNLIIFISAFQLLLANIIAVGFLMLSSSNIQYEYLWIGLAIVMMYIIFQIRDKSSKSLKECKSWTKNDFGKIGEFKYKLYHRVGYHNIWVLTGFIIIYIFFLNTI